MTRDYFGEIDAARAEMDDLEADHLGRAITDRLKCGESDRGSTIVVGADGTGKTDLRLAIQRDDPDALLFVLDAGPPSRRIGADIGDLPSGVGKNVIATELLTLFTTERVPGFLEQVRAASAPVVGLARSFARRFSYEGFGFRYRSGERDEEESDGELETDWTALAGKLSERLREKRGYMLIDDVESVVPGIEHNPELVEALCRAVVEINHQLGQRLHVLIFLKQGLWRSWFENQRKCGSIKDSIEYITWDHDALVDLIARRIRSRRELHDEDSEHLWRYDFMFDDFDEFTRRFTELCVNGPRDMLTLCNACAERADGAKIGIEHLDAVVPEFSEARFSELGAEFGRVYPDVEKFVRQVFTGARDTLSKDDLAVLIESKGILDQRAEAEFASQSWFSMRLPEHLAELMYEIGVVNVLAGDVTVSTLNDPTIPRARIAMFTVHPAFRSVLSTVPEEPAEPAARQRNETVGTSPAAAVSEPAQRAAAATT